MDTIMTALQFKVDLIPARQLLRDPSVVPAHPGAYLFFFKGGTRLLRATSYFDYETRRPLTVRGRQHLYTGAARDLRIRLRQHMEADVTSSSLRMTLLAIEQGYSAISLSGTPDCSIKGEKTLTKWLCRNAYIGLLLDQDPFGVERKLLAQHPSPFNIVMRRQHPYARRLSKCRQCVFPANDPGSWRRVRYV
jgi:hypothetical protein